MKQYYMKFLSDKPCPTCGGERLRPESRAVKVGGSSIVDLSKMTIRQALDFLAALDLSKNEATIAAELLKEIRSRLSFLADVGLTYLSLDRAA